VWTGPAARGAGRRRSLRTCGRVLATVALAATAWVPALPAQGATGGAAAQAQVQAVVHLTFDDGPHATWTPQVLDALRRHGARATFFVVGTEVQRYPHLVRRALAEGHRVENHTMNHRRLDLLSASGVRDELLGCDRAIRAAGGPPTTCFRPPYGARSTTVLQVAADLGLRMLWWTVDPGDHSRPGTSVIVSRVLSAVRPGSVILLHDGGGNRSQTVAALDTILPELRRRGYGFGFPCGPPPPPPSRAGLAIFRAPEWHLRRSLTSPPTTATFAYGQVGDVPLIGDWNGDGTRTPGVRRGDVWHLRTSLPAGPADIVFAWGRPGDLPVVGDWNGNGRDGIGILRGRDWYLKNTLDAGPHQVHLVWGRPGDLPVVGDWNSNGRDGIAIFREGQWYFKNRLDGSPHEGSTAYGMMPGDVPLRWGWTP
jgi:peptidoglycan-N-acetylglucosamine deacetylase